MGLALGSWVRAQGGRSGLVSGSSSRLGLRGRERGRDTQKLSTYVDPDLRYARRQGLCGVYARLAQPKAPTLSKGRISVSC